MSKSRIPSPARSDGAAAPRRYRPPSTRSMRSNTSYNSVRLSDLVQDSSVISKTRKSVLTDNTNIDQPMSTSWWKKLNDSSREIMDVLDSNSQPNEVELENVLDFDVISPEKKSRNYTAFADSSDNESIKSIDIPQRRPLVYNNRATTNRLNSFKPIKELLMATQNTTSPDETLVVVRKKLFNKQNQQKNMVYPTEAFALSSDNTTEIVLPDNNGPKNLFSNRQVPRVNRYTNDVALECKDEIPELQPQMFRSIKSAEERNTRQSLGEWKDLPSSTLIENQFINTSIDMDNIVKQETPSDVVDLQIMQENQGINSTNVVTLSSKLELEPQQVFENSLNNTRDAVDGYDENNALQVDVGKIEKSVTNKLLENVSETSTDIDQNIVPECSNHLRDKENNLDIVTDDQFKIVQKENTTSENIKLGIEETYRKAEDTEVNITKKTINNETASVVIQVENNKDKIHDNHQESNSHKEKTINQRKIIDKEEIKESQQDFQNEQERIEECQLEVEVQQVVINEKQQKTQNKLEVMDKKQEIYHKNPQEAEHEQEKIIKYKEGNKDVQRNLNKSLQNVENEQAEIDKSQQKVEREREEIDKRQQVIENEQAEINENSQAIGDKQENINECQQNVEDEQQKLNETQQKFEDEHEKMDESQQDIQDEQEELVESQSDDENEQDELDENQSEDENEQEELDESQELVEDEQQEMDESQQEIEDEQEEFDVSQPEDEDEQEEIDESQQEVDDEQEESNKSQSQQNFDESHQEGDGDEMEEAQEDIVESEQEDEDDSEKLVYEEDAEQDSNEQIDEISAVVAVNKIDESVKSPEVILRDVTNKNNSFQAHRNTSARKTKSIGLSLLKRSLLPARDSTGIDTDTTGEGSGWDSHRTTRKTLRQTFGKDFSPRKSLRTLVLEKESKRKTYDVDMEPQANSTEFPEMFDQDEEIESDHETSRLKQARLDMLLNKIKKDMAERRNMVAEKVKNSLQTKPNSYFDHVFKVPTNPAVKRKANPKPQIKSKKFQPYIIPTEALPKELAEDLQYKPPKRYKPPNATWATKRLYHFLEKKLEPKYNYKARVRAERVVEQLHEFVSALRRPAPGPAPARRLQRDLARLGLVTTYFDFYDFIREYMPKEIKIKVIPDIVNRIPKPSQGVFSNILDTTSEMDID